MSVFSEENSEENHYFTVFFTSGENSEENHYFIVFFTSEENSEEKSQRSEIIFPTHEKKLEKHEVIPVRIEQITFILPQKIVNGNLTFVGNFACSSLICDACTSP